MFFFSYLFVKYRSGIRFLPRKVHLTGATGLIWILAHKLWHILAHTHTPSRTNTSRYACPSKWNRKHKLIWSNIHILQDWLKRNFTRFDVKKKTIRRIPRTYIWYIWWNQVWSAYLINHKLKWQSKNQTKIFIKNVVHRHTDNNWMIWQPKWSDWLFKTFFAWF